MAYATPGSQHLVTLEVPVGTTIAAAVERCRDQRLLPEAAFQYSDLGVFGRRVRAERVLEPGDRVEIYRPLEVDPKEARRRRAQGGRRTSSVQTPRGGKKA
ncbi:MAG: RnfH family protein [Gammaproteobacteria bacterium]|nr:RnfH family protein [Gammaproteobacteria bacterium]